MAARLVMELQERSVRILTARDGFRVETIDQPYQSKAAKQNSNMPKPRPGPDEVQVSIEKIGLLFLNIVLGEQFASLVCLKTVSLIEDKKEANMSLFVTSSPPNTSM